MKNYRMMILVVLLTLVGRTMADNLTLETVKMSAGETKQIAIVLSNPTFKYAAFQFDLVLPEGITVAKNDKGKLMINLDADRVDDHTLTVQDLGSGDYRLLCFSMSNAEFYGTSGALVNMTLQADENVSTGTRQGQITSQVFTEPDGNQVRWDDLSFNISISASSESGNEGNNLTVSEIELKIGNTQEATINLNNGSKKYAAFQFDMILLEGITVAKNDKGKLTVSLNADRIEDHTLDVQEVGSNTYRFLCFSMTNSEFYGTSGPLLNIIFQADKAVNEGKYDGIIKSQVFTEMTGDQVKWDDMTFPILVSDLIGDANGDGEINITDITYIIDKINNRPADDFNKEAADLNDDDEINITDVTLLLDIINGVK